MLAIQITWHGTGFSINLQIIYMFGVMRSSESFWLGNLAVIWLADWLSCVQHRKETTKQNTLFSVHTFITCIILLNVWTNFFLLALQFFSLKKKILFTSVLQDSSNNDGIIRCHSEWCFWQHDNVYRQDLCRILLLSQKKQNKTKGCISCKVLDNQNYALHDFLSGLHLL